MSRNYPNNYDHNTDCEWLLTVEERHSVVLTFVEFDVEGSSDCRYDYVAVRLFFKPKIVDIFFFFYFTTKTDVVGVSPLEVSRLKFKMLHHEIFSTVILSLPLIQEGQLSVSGKRMCTILMNRLED